MRFIVSLPVLFQRLFPHIACFIPFLPLLQSSSTSPLNTSLVCKLHVFSHSSLILMPSHDSLLLCFVYFLLLLLHLCLCSFLVSYILVSAAGRPPELLLLTCFQLIIPLNLKHPLYLLGDVEERRWAARHCGNVPSTCGGCCVGWSRAVRLIKLSEHAVGAPPSIRLWGVKWGVRPRCSVRLALKQHWTPTELMHMQNCISYCSRVMKLHTLKRQKKHAKEQWWAMCYSQHPAYVLFVDGGGERAPSRSASRHLSLQCFQFIRDLLISKRRLVKVVLTPLSRRAGWSRKRVI